MLTNTQQNKKFRNTLCLQNKIKLIFTKQKRKFTNKLCFQNKIKVYEHVMFKKSLQTRYVYKNESLQTSYVNKTKQNVCRQAMFTNIKQN